MEALAVVAAPLEDHHSELLFALLISDKAVRHVVKTRDQHRDQSLLLLQLSGRGIASPVRLIDVNDLRSGSLHTSSVDDSPFLLIDQTVESSSHDSDGLSDEGMLRKR